MLILLRLGGVPLMGGTFVPSVSRSPWGDSLEEGGAAHGPLHPAVFILKVVWFLYRFRGCRSSFVLGQLHGLFFGDLLVWIL